MNIDGHDIHCYVQTEDGRTYTAISRIPSELGWDLQVWSSVAVAFSNILYRHLLQGLVPLGTVISWMFSVAQDGGVNGFKLTGGVLNYTAEVYYPDTGEQASLEFKFMV